jgi:hypothetical protein
MSRLLTPVLCACWRRNFSSCSSKRKASKDRRRELREVRHSNYVPKRCNAAMGWYAN